MKQNGNHFDVIIAGAGPAGTSAAIHLSLNGLAVLLIEQKQFPRAKLCGEFISPECLDHFERLGVAPEMNSSSGSLLSQTVFYSRRGRAVRVPSEWFGGHRTALGLSRAEMDNNLLQRAKDCGVTVLEEAQASRPLIKDGSVVGVVTKSKQGENDYFAGITIDATGRSRALARRVETNPSRRISRSLVAFKAHLVNAHGEPGACEIYLYKGGYGGLNAVEGGVSNLCFIVSAKDARACESNAEQLVRRIVSQNPRAAYTLANVEAVTPWLAVKLDDFGFQSLVPAKGMLTVGDAAAFIDPFTGSGMLMALQSGELVAAAIINNRDSFSRLADKYSSEYRRLFKSRLRLCGVLRAAAFIPRLTESAVILASSERVRRILARGTRGGLMAYGKLRTAKS